MDNQARHPYFPGVGRQTDMFQRVADVELEFISDLLNGMFLQLQGINVIGEKFRGPAREAIDTTWPMV
jgi:hypothetical protein